MTDRAARTGGNRQREDDMTTLKAPRKTGHWLRNDFPAFRMAMSGGQGRRHPLRNV